MQMLSAPKVFTLSPSLDGRGEFIQFLPVCESHNLCFQHWYDSRQLDIVISCLGIIMIGYLLLISITLVTDQVLTVLTAVQTQNKQNLQYE